MATGSALSTVAGTGSSVETPRIQEPSYRLIEDLVEGIAVRHRLDAGHVEMLAGVLEHCPPILVTDSGTIVDGRHRLAAARRAGWVRIPTVVLEDDAPGAELLAALAGNASHGLPLTREERRAGVRTVLAVRPELSDRSVAQTCGVARSVVAAVRTELYSSGGRDHHLNARAGRDGKRYPVDPRRGREIVEAIVRVDPTMGVRSLASLAGVSVGAAHERRRRVLSQVAAERWVIRWLRRLRARWVLRRHGIGWPGQRLTPRS